jgi:hypothetical protein
MECTQLAGLPPGRLIAERYLLLPGHRFRHQTRAVISA